MIPALLIHKWALYLWFFSGLIFSKTPLTCVATAEEKGSILVTDENLFRRSYRLEDFFWTGSGDDPPGEETLYNETEEETHPLFPEHIGTWRTTTIFHTTTILFATVYPNPIEGCSDLECKPKISPVWTRSVEFSSPVHSSYGIEPTPTEKHRQRATKLRNVTVFSEITKVLTVTEKVGSSGKTFRHSPEKTTSPVNTELSTVASSANNTGVLIDELDGIEGSGAAFPRFDIEMNATSTSIYTNPVPEQRYWLLTVLKCDTLPDGIKIRLIEEKLSTLYRKAFIRQQEKHFGINGNSVTTSRPRRDRRIPEPVKVRIHNVTDAFGHNSQEVAVLYSVTVAGKPVPAVTAANDMKLIPLNEVVAELGYPVLTKAEPYSKEIMPLGARIKGRSRDTWLLIGAVIAAVSLLIILAIIFTFGLSDGEGTDDSTSTNNKKQVFEVEEGSCNLAFRDDSDIKDIKIDRSKSPGRTFRYDNVGASGASVTFADQRRGSSSSSSCSGSSESSLVRLRCQQRKRDQKKEEIDEKPHPKPRTRMRKIQNDDATLEDVIGDRQILRTSYEKTDKGISNEGIQDVEVSSRNTRTPTSYLSMPSVKAFPRGAKIPEPLNRVLEPISIRYLDGDADNLSQNMKRLRSTDENSDNDLSHNRPGKFRKELGMTRHASLEGDPGVVGPFVWKREYLKTNNFEKDVYGFNQINGNVNVGKMRKRFSDLIDDAFNLFGSRGDNSGEGEGCGSDFIPTKVGTDSRVHSALIRPVESFYNFSSGARPKTTDSRRSLTVALKQGPRGAWDSPICPGPSKPTFSSAIIDENSILVDGNFPPGDPAVPLIKAIKNELQKFDKESTKPADNNPID